MIRRGKWTGMLTILRFNFPFYVAAVVILIAAATLIFAMETLPVKIVCGLAAAGAAHFLIVSLVVSHLVYDRSDLYRWRWLKRALCGVQPECVVVCHSGFDEVSVPLRDALKPARLIILDHFAEEHMSEPSIRRARRMFPPVAGTLNAPHDAWPVETRSLDVVFGLLAIHELRSVEERRRWFHEARRCLMPGGRVILAEHLRNLPNFLAFGPGFLHFHSAARWRQSFAPSGFHPADEFSITPWIRVFVLTAE